MKDTIEFLNKALAGRYHVERELGAGGMATVFLANDLRHDRRVAIKVLRPELAAVLGADRFVREIRTVAQLQHPHILGLIDSGEIEGTAFYVMPFVKGNSLRDLLNREKQLPVADALRITTEIASALDYAHRNGVIHRDIKPENILLHDGAALLADFGVALEATRSNGDDRITESGISLGTPQYMSPEQAMGERDITPRSDIFALGCVTYEMLAGEAPFTGPNAQAIIARVTTSDPAPVTKVRRRVPQHVSEAIQTALEKLPADRFSGAAQFAAALRGESAAASVRSRRSAFAEVWPWKVVSASFAAIAVLLLVAWSTDRRAKSSGTRIAAALILPDSAALNVRRAEIAISPDGQHVVYAGTAENALYMRALASLTPQMIPRTSGASHPAFSPDGRWLAYLEPAGRLVKIPFPADGQPPTAVLDSVAGYALGDNNAIIFTRVVPSGQTSGLWLSTTEGATPRLLVPPDTAAPGNVFSHLHLLPGSRAAIFTTVRSGRTQFDLASVDLRTGNVDELNVAGVSGRYLSTGHLLAIQQDGSAAVVPFDLRRLIVTGKPRVLLDSVFAQGIRTFLDVSSAGTLAYISGRPFEELVRVDRRGSVTYVYGRQWVRYATPRFSPMCDRAAVMSVPPGNPLPTNQIVYAPDVSRVIRLTSDNRSGTSAWVDNGRALVWFSRPLPTDSNPVSTVYRQNWDGTGQRQVVTTVKNPLGAVNATADGSLILYGQGARESDHQLYLMSPDSGAIPRLVTSPPGVKNGAVISPNGKWIAYTADAGSGRQEIFVIPASGSEKPQRITEGGATEPAWAHDGLSIYYRSSFSGGSVIMSARPDWMLQTHLQYRPLPTATSVDSLFPNPYSRYDRSRYYDVCRDGTFLMLRSGAPQQKLVVITGWLDQVRRQLATGAPP